MKELLNFSKKINILSLTINYFLYGLVVVSNGLLYSQNENSKWYFGNYAGLDFMTNPPSILTNGAMNIGEGCASIANSTGNLLFYTDGATIWNQQHLVMANGSGLLGNGPMGTGQAAIIAKKPGSTTLYYVFTLDDVGGPNGLMYSIVDMSLASGSGSVVTKNVPIYAPSSEKMTGVKHCNGIDWWIVTHESTGNVFRSYLLTVNGLSVTPVYSSAGAPFAGSGSIIGRMKISPDGKKLVMSSGQTLNLFELFNFDTSTGAITYSLTLYLNSIGGTGVEFSPDATKLYTTRWNGAEIVQWDLCAGSMQAIQSSSISIQPTTPILGKGGLQLAPNGKIYVARWSGPELGVINNPNALGLACNYTETGQPLTPNLCNTTLPNFLVDFPKPIMPNFTTTISNCLEASFSTPTVAPISSTNCYLPISSVTGQSWDFGEASSGTLNISTSSNPTHTYSTIGSYSVTLIIYYSCGLANDTIKKTITINKPTITITGKTNLCKGNTTTITATGASSYSWNSGAQTSSIVITPTVTTTYTVVGTSTNNGCASTKVTTVSVLPCTSIEEQIALNKSIIVFPNPCTSILTIESLLSANVSVFDALGREVYNRTISIGENKVDLSILQNGVYFIEFKREDWTKKSKIILAK